MKTIKEGDVVVIKEIAPWTTSPELIEEIGVVERVEDCSYELRVSGRQRIYVTSRPAGEIAGERHDDGTETLFYYPKQLTVIGRLDD